MDLFHHLGSGWSAAWTQQHLGLALLGCLLGLLMGALPGLGPVVAIALLLPLAGALGPVASLILLASVHCGAQYGAITVRTLMPPEGSSSLARTALDAHQLARQGRAGLALGVAGLASVASACLAVGAMLVFAPLLTELAFHFGPAEYFSLMVLSLVGAVALSPGSLIKALAMIVLGLLLSQVGATQVSRLFEHALGVPDAFGQLHFVVLAIGLFAFGDILTLLDEPAAARQPVMSDPGPLCPSREVWRQVQPTVWRGGALGTLLGLLPGGGAVLAALVSHKLERRLAGQGGQFGRGDLRGVAGPSAALQAGVQASFLPMLTFGIPLNAVMALLLGAMALKGITPGPQVMSAQPGFFWGLLVALGLSHGLILLLNLPLLRVWSGLMSLPYRFVFPLVVLAGCLGVYAVRGQVLDLYLAAGLALAGYLFHKLRCPLAPLLLGFILGPMMESHLRLALQPQGDWRVLVTRPVSVTLLLLATALVVFVLLPSVRRPREAAFNLDPAVDR